MQPLDRSPPFNAQSLESSNKPMLGLNGRVQGVGNQTFNEIPDLSDELDSTSHLYRVFGGTGGLVDEDEELGCFQWSSWEPILRMWRLASLVVTVASIAGVVLNFNDEKSSNFIVSSLLFGMTFANVMELVFPSDWISAVDNFTTEWSLEFFMGMSQITRNIPSTPLFQQPFVFVFTAMTGALGVRDIKATIRHEGGRDIKIIPLSADKKQSVTPMLDVPSLSPLYTVALQVVKVGVSALLIGLDYRYSVPLVGDAGLLVAGHSFGTVSASCYHFFWEKMKIRAILRKRSQVISKILRIGAKATTLLQQVLLSAAFVSTNKPLMFFAGAAHGAYQEQRLYRFLRLQWTSRNPELISVNQSAQTVSVINQGQLQGIEHIPTEFKTISNSLAYKISKHANRLFFLLTFSWFSYGLVVSESPRARFGIITILSSLSGGYWVACKVRNVFAAHRHLHHDGFTNPLKKFLEKANTKTINTLYFYLQYYPDLFMIIFQFITLRVAADRQAFVRGDLFQQAMATIANSALGFAVAANRAESSSLKYKEEHATNSPAVRYLLISNVLAYFRERWRWR